MKDQVSMPDPLKSKNQQWQVNLNLTPEGVRNDPAGAFLPQSGYKRPVPHKKTNECDH